MQSLSTQRKGQKGNVLFLILIAVALFAALSYAVTQSSRSGGDSNRETRTINTAQLTQYPNQIRTAVSRLMVSEGQSADALQFNAPTQFGNTGFVAGRSVFSPTGGGAPYQTIPGNMLTSGLDTGWVFTFVYGINNVGTNGAVGSTAGNDLIAMAIGLTDDNCSNLNNQLHRQNVIPVQTTAATLPTVDTSAPIEPNAERVVSAAGTIAIGANVATFAPTVTGLDLSGQASGCFKNGASGANVFYVVLVER